MVPLLNDLGVDARWQVIKGDESFFQITKKFHNALHGRSESLAPEEFVRFLDVTRENLATMNLAGDIFFIHDPQPIALVTKRKELGGKWSGGATSTCPRGPEGMELLEGVHRPVQRRGLHGPQFQPEAANQAVHDYAIHRSPERQEPGPASESVNAVWIVSYSGDKPIITQISGSIISKTLWA